MALIIKDAVKERLRARIALLAPTGGGKTFSGLKFLFAMVKLGMARKVGVVDTEHGSASKYIGEFPAFRVIEMEDDFSPEQYIEALTMLADDGCDAVLIDSLSHAWGGKGGSLEQKDKIGRQKGFNDYTAWGPISAMQNRMIEAILSYPGHLVATMRLKMEHVLEEDPITKKKVVRKVGLQPVQRDGLEYEFDLVGDLDQDHNFSVSKTRCSALDGYQVVKPGEEVIRKMKAWLESGAAPVDRQAGKPAPVRAAPPPDATTTLAPVAAPATPEEAMSERPAVELGRQLDEAQTLVELDVVVSFIAAAVKVKQVSEQERLQLGARHKARKAQLAPSAARTTETIDHPAIGFAKALTDAATKAALDAVVSEIAAGVKSGAVSADERKQLLGILAQRNNALASAAT